MWLTQKNTHTSLLLFWQPEAGLMKIVQQNSYAMFLVTVSISSILKALRMLVINRLLENVH